MVTLQISLENIVYIANQVFLHIYMYLALVIGVYDPSIFCIAVFDINVEKPSLNLIRKVNDRFSVCCILVVFSHILLKQIDKQIIIIVFSFFIMYMTYI